MCMNSSEAFDNYIQTFNYVIFNVIKAYITI
jgi:hypothetical protein